MSSSGDDMTDSDTSDADTTFDNLSDINDPDEIDTDDDNYLKKLSDEIMEPHDNACIIFPVYDDREREKILMKTVLYWYRMNDDFVTEEFKIALQCYLTEIKFDKNSLFMSLFSDTFLTCADEYAEYVITNYTHLFTYELLSETCLLHRLMALYLPNEIIIYLCDSKTDAELLLLCNQKDDDGETLLDIVIFRFEPELLYYLLDKGAELVSDNDIYNYKDIETKGCCSLEEQRVIIKIISEHVVKLNLWKHSLRNTWIMACTL